MGDTFVLTIKIVFLYHGLGFGGLSQCEMLYRTNLFAVIAGGRYPKYSLNTVLMYDALQQKFVMELNCSSAVKTVRMRRNKLVYTIVLLYRDFHSIVLY